MPAAPFLSPAAAAAAAAGVAGVQGLPPAAAAAGVAGVQRLPPAAATAAAGVQGLTAGIEEQDGMDLRGDDGSGQHAAGEGGGVGTPTRSRPSAAEAHTLDAFSPPSPQGAHARRHASPQHGASQHRTTPGEGGAIPPRGVVRPLYSPGTLPQVSVGT